MPKPVSPDRPIWPPLPTEPERQAEGAPAQRDSPEPLPAEADAAMPGAGLEERGALPG